VPLYAKLRARDIAVSVANQDQETVCSLNVTVRPQPFVANRTVHFHHWGDDMLRQTLDVTDLIQHFRGTDKIITPSVDAARERSFQNPVSSSKISSGTVDAAVNGNAATDLHILSHNSVTKVRCSNDQVVFDFVLDQDQKPKIHFKVQTSHSSSTTHFFFALFTDVYCCNLHSIIRVNVYAHDRENFTAVVGQRRRNKLFLPSFAATKCVKCVTNCQDEMVFDAGTKANKDQSFHLLPGQVNQVDFFYKTVTGGKRVFLVHLVDVDTHQLLHSWLFQVDAVYPRVDSQFVVVCPLGDKVGKHFQYDNHYKSDKVFVCESSSPSKLEVKKPVLTIPSLTTRNIQLTFLPQSVPHTDTMYLFISNQEGKVEDTLRFDVTYRAGV